MKRLVKLWGACTAIMLFGVLVAGCGGGGGGGGESSSVDLFRPEISQTLPVNGATNVGTTTPITITFSEPMNQDSVKAAFSLTGGANTGTLSVNGSTATFTPSALTPLDPNTTYTATIAASATDKAGNSLVGNKPAGEYTWTFTTGAGADTTPPTVQSYAPTGTTVAINSTIAISFSEPMDTDSVAYTLKQGGTDIPGTLSFTGNTAVFTPSASLDYFTTYTVTITTAEDLAGNKMAAPFTWDFTTALPPAVDLEAPSVEQNSNSPTGTGVPRDTPISVSFNEPITPFYYGSINGYPTKVDIDYTTNTVTMKPTTLLTASTPYTVSIQVRDLAGNLMPLYQWQFTTGTTP